MRAMFDPMAEDVDGAAPRDLALQPREELAPGRTLLVQGQGFGGLRLCGTKEGGQLHAIDTIFAVVVEPVPAPPAHAAVARRRFADRFRRGWLAGIPRKSGADQAF